MNQMKIYRVEQKNEEPVEVQIIRSSRRSMGLQVKADGTVCARVPMQVMDYAVQEFIEGHADWIFKKRKLVLSKDNRPDIVYLPEVTEESDRERIQTFIEEKVSYYASVMDGSLCGIRRPGGEAAAVKEISILIADCCLCRTGSWIM